jgi:hypothetical protein
MRLLISIADFPGIVPFSVNIDPLLVDPHIRDAQTFDVKLGTALYAKLDEALQLTQPEFSPDEFDTQEFKAAAATAGWADDKLASLWYSAVRPLLVCHAARRMMLWHGAHITPNGLETISDVGHMPISTAVRAELRSDLQAKCSHYEALLLPALRSYQPITTPSTCGTSRRRPTRGGLKTHTA